MTSCYTFLRCSQRDKLRDKLSIEPPNSWSRSKNRNDTNIKFSMLCRTQTQNLPDWMDVSEQQIPHPDGSVNIISMWKCFTYTVWLKASWCKCSKIGATRQSWLVKRGNNSETQALKQWDTAEAEGQKAGTQQVPQGGQVGDGEVVRVQTPSPHHTDDEVCDIKEDGHLKGEDKLGLEKTKVVDIMGEHTSNEHKNTWQVLWFLKS